MPTKTRPADVPAEAATSTRPPDPTAEELALAQSDLESTSAIVAAGLEKPAMEPPSSAAGAMATAGAGWITSKHVLMLWQTGAPTDNWFYLDGGIGWKRITQTNDVAARGMGQLASGARCGGGLVHIYEGTTSGVADAFYLW